MGGVAPAPRPERQHQRQAGGPRQPAPGRERAGAHLSTPRAPSPVTPDTKKHTPLPPTEPVGQNPPAGAIIDYWLGAKAKGTVTLEIRDSAGQVVRRFASNAPEKLPKAERYFAKDWTRPPEALSAAPGTHRFVWNLRYARPEAIGYDYSIAAVWGENTPVNPGGAFVLPGDYTVVLTAGGESHTAPLHVAEDPRVSASMPRLSARQTSPATETRPEPFPDTRATGVWPRGAQVRALGGRRFCPASSSKTIHAPLAAASLVPSPRSPSATP